MEKYEWEYMVTSIVVKQLTHNQKIVGSSPSRSTIII